MSFKKGFFAVALLLVALMTFGGCGGGGGGGDNPNPPTPTTLTGKFIDGPVQNLGYFCEPSGLYGTTNSSGEFKYQVDDEVMFFLGTGEGVTALEFPFIDAASKITPMSYYPDEAKDGENVIKMVRLMMSAGFVVEATGGIILSSNPFPRHGGAYNADKWDEINGAGLIKVDEDKAKEHFDPDKPDPVPDPDPTDSKINGTWKFVAATDTNGASYPVTTVPTKFKMEMLLSGTTYDLKLNDGKPVTYTYGNSGGTIDQIFSGWEKVSNSPERYTRAGDPGVELELSLSGDGNILYYDLYAEEKGGLARSWTFHRDGYNPAPIESTLNGTWKITSVSATYEGKTETVVPTTLTPTTFPVKILQTGSTYTIDVNNGNRAEWKYEYPSSGGGGGGGYAGSLPTASGLRKVGSGEKYEYTSDGVVATVELMNAITAVAILDEATTEGKRLVIRLTLTRQKYAGGDSVRTARQ